MDLRRLGVARRSNVGLIESVGRLAYHTRFREMSPSLEATRVMIYIAIELWNVTGISNGRRELSFQYAPTEEDEKKLYDRFFQAGVFIVPGFGMPYPQPGWARFTITTKMDYLQLGKYMLHQTYFVWCLDMNK